VVMSSNRLLRFLRRAKQACDDARDSLPICGFLAELALPPARDGIVFCPAIVIGDAPFRADPAALLQAEERRVDSPLVEMKQVAGDLFQAAGQAEAMERTGGIKGFEHHQIESALKNFGAGFGQGCLLLKINRRVRPPLLTVNR